MGLKVVRAAMGQIELTVPWREEFISNPDQRYVHGGILAALLDTAGLWPLPPSWVGWPRRSICADYLRPGFEAQLAVKSNVTRYGRTLSNAVASVLNAEGKVLATGQMVFNGDAMTSAPVTSRPVL